MRREAWARITARTVRRRMAARRVRGVCEDLGREVPRIWDGWPEGQEWVAARDQWVRLRRLKEQAAGALDDAGWAILWDEATKVASLARRARRAVYRQQAAVGEERW